MSKSEKLKKLKKKYPNKKDSLLEELGEDVATFVGDSLLDRAKTVKAKKKKTGDMGVRG